MSDFKDRMKQLKENEFKRTPGKGDLKRPLMQFNMNARKEIKRGRRVTILLTDDEYEGLSEQAAGFMVNGVIGTTLSDFIRRSLFQ